MSTPRYRWYVAVVAAIVVVTAISALGGFNGLQESRNAGGNTSCREFVTLGLDAQHVTVRKFLEQRSSARGEPGDGTVDKAISAVWRTCRDRSDRDTPIAKTALSDILG